MENLKPNGFTFTVNGGQKIVEGEPHWRDVINVTMGRSEALRLLSVLANQLQDPEETEFVLVWPGELNLDEVGIWIFDGLSQLIDVRIGPNAVGESIQVPVTCVTWTLKHSGSPKGCMACRSSMREPCRQCGHALTGRVENGVTVCENCGEPHRADRW